jgi:hypothetical protein
MPSRTRQRRAIEAVLREAERPLNPTDGLEGTVAVRPPVGHVVSAGYALVRKRTVPYFESML